MNDEHKSMSIDEVVLDELFEVVQEIALEFDLRQGNFKQWYACWVYLGMFYETLAPTPRLAIANLFELSNITFHYAPDMKDNHGEQ